MKSSTMMIVSGILAIIGGVAALAFPLPASLAVTVLVGWAFIVSGALQMWAAFSNDAMGHRGWVGAMGLLSLVVGVWMLANPLAGMISLTVMVGALLVFSGAARIAGGFTTYKGTQLQWMLVVSGIVTVALGLYILGALPVTGVVTLGILVAVELIVMGATLLAAGMALRSRA